MVVNWPLIISCTTLVNTSTRTVKVGLGSRSVLVLLFVCVFSLRLHIKMAQNCHQFDLPPWLSGRMHVTAVHESAVQIKTVATFFIFKVFFLTVFWKLWLGLGLDLELHYFSIFHGQ